MTHTKNNTSLDAHAAYCSEVDKISQARFGLNACDLLNDEDKACQIIQAGWSDDTPAEVVIDNLNAHRATN